VTLTVRLDPVTLNIEITPNRGLSGREFDELVLPSCPICGTTINLDRVNVMRMEDRWPVYVPGRWTCPRGCYPIPEGGYQ